MTTVAAVIYRAPHMKQLVSSDPFGKFNCSAVGLARATNAATIGGVRVTGKDVRALSNEPIPDPNSPGLNIPQLVAVSKKLRVPILDRTGEDWAQVVAVLDTTGPGRRVLAAIHYPEWRERCQQVNIDFGHMVTLDALRRKDGRMQILGSDPLCNTLTWYDASAVRDAMLAWAHQTGMTSGGLRFAVTREIPLLALVS